MPKIEHQTLELSNAFRDLIKLENAKAKLEVANILKNVMNEETAFQALKELAEWVAK